MAVVNISLPNQLKEYVESRVSESGYGTTSEYFRDLIRQDQKHQDKEKLESMLLQGLESPAVKWTKNDVARIKKAVREPIR